VEEKKSPDNTNEMNTTRSLGSKQITNVVKLSDVNSFKPKKDLAETFG